MLEGLEKTMPALVDSVLENSIAEELEIEKVTGVPVLQLMV